jgi:hypothetical protein
VKFTLLPPSEQIRPYAWDAAYMRAHLSWRFEVPLTAHLDAEALEGWASQQAEPILSLRKESLETPTLRSLGSIVGHELTQGTGVAWITGFSEFSENTLRLIFLKIGLELGNTIDTYGRLYDVNDSGLSYRDKAIPVSQTRESTTMHTDSSNKDVHPNIIGLCCARQAKIGGDSRLASAAYIHELMRREVPDLLPLLYQSFVRDVVTPNSDRDLASVAMNRFPIFSFNEQLAIRYMRYWIEMGHQRIGEPLQPDVIRSFDYLDQLLMDPVNVLTFRMLPGDIVLINNRSILHDRSAYQDNPNSPRLLFRLWLD